MSLSAREQRALDSITDRLAGSDPELATLLTGFTRLVSGEEMPLREGIRAGSRRAIRWVPAANGGTLEETKYTGPPGACPGAWVCSGPQCCCRS